MFGNKPPRKPRKSLFLLLLLFLSTERIDFTDLLPGQAHIFSHLSVLLFTLVLGIKNMSHFHLSAKSSVGARKGSESVDRRAWDNGCAMLN